MSLILRILETYDKLAQVPYTISSSSRKFQSVMSTTTTFAHERRGVLAIASLYAFRMMGLFMILPVFSLYATTLANANGFLIGLAFGAYGLTQALLQIPFGFLSDRIGRKPVIAIGLILFAIGSIVAALSDSIYITILGRALQGTGAIGSTLIAMVADITREENRTKAMAVIGMVIGTSFMVAMVLGSWLNSYIGVSGIFWLTAGLALSGIVILYTAVPTPISTVSRPDDQTVPALFKSVLTQVELLRLDLGIFCQHAILTASFIVIPIALQQHLHWEKAEQWHFYLPLFLLSFLAMVPLIIFAEKKQQQKPIFLGAIVTIVIAQLALAAFHSDIWEFVAGLLIFFTAFNLLEANLPSLISKLAPAGSKGTAMGIYSTAQFLGIFFGGAFGGWLNQHYQLTGVFLGCSALAFGWLLVAFKMQKPQKASRLSVASADALGLK